MLRLLATHDAQCPSASSGRLDAAPILQTFEARRPQSVKFPFKVGTNET